MQIFDSHIHIFDPRFPLQPNNDYVPNHFTIEDYKVCMQPYDLVGGVIVAASFQAENELPLKTALRELGPSYAGITQLSGDISEEAVLALHASRIRGIRFNLYRSKETMRNIRELACKVYDIAHWHSEFYIDSKYLEEYSTRFLALPKVSNDHLGISRTGFHVLLKLVEQGVHVKASGFGRTDLNVASALSELYSINPEAFMFGSDLPSTRAMRAFSHCDTDLINQTFSRKDAEKIFRENGKTFYGVAIS